MKKVLFVCNQGQHRSRTAAELFASKNSTEYAGIYSETRPVTKEKLSWAEIVIVMEVHQRAWIGSHFPSEYLRLKIVNWAVPDVYSYGSDKLIALLKGKTF